MSFPASADTQASIDRANQPTLLGVPAELRNIIYDKVFSSETKHGIAPHALTRVNRCIRRESLTMYYASVRYNTLEIVLHNPTQFAHAKQWLAELSKNLYTVLPDIEFSWTEYRAFGNRKFALRCARQVTTLKKEFGKQILSCDLTEMPSWLAYDEARRQTYNYCLGFSELHVRIPPLPSYFEKALGEHRKWTVRHLSLLPESCTALYIPMFEELAHRKNGCEWDMCDLRYIIESLETVASKATTWVRKSLQHSSTVGHNSMTGEENGSPVLAHRYTDGLYPRDGWLQANARRKR